MMRILPTLCLAASILLPASHTIAQPAGHPRPSPYPVAWEFDFEFDAPRRVVLELPDRGTPQAFWFMTYTVTNNTDRERMFLPVFEMLTPEGQVVRSDRNVPREVFQTIRRRTGNEFLESALEIAGELRVGEDQARDGVAIWREPPGGVGREFTIFISGLSGEIARVSGPDDQSLILRKTLRLDYRIRGDVARPSPADLELRDQAWIMR